MNYFAFCPVFGLDEVFRLHQLRLTARLCTTLLTLFVMNSINSLSNVKGFLKEENSLRFFGFALYQLVQGFAQNDKIILDSRLNIPDYKLRGQALGMTSKKNPSVFRIR